MIQKFSPMLVSIVMEKATAKKQTKVSKYGQQDWPILFHGRS